ncbi:hypothetical protein B0H14DRAFT_2587225 [Mycena olivaceomarginata]|nr:hypothetical protein B0H14DRAFT_2587225 [Mycena olivaceomarginata]
MTHLFSHFSAYFVASQEMFLVIPTRTQYYTYVGKREWITTKAQIELYSVGRSAAGKSGDLGVDRLDEEADVEEDRDGTREAVQVEMARRGRLGWHDGIGLTTSTLSLPEYRRRQHGEVAGSSTIMMLSSESGSGQRLGEELWKGRVSVGVGTSNVVFFINTSTDSNRANEERLVGRERSDFGRTAEMGGRGSAPSVTKKEGVS